MTRRITLTLTLDLLEGARHTFETTLPEHLEDAADAAVERLQERYGYGFAVADWTYSYDYHRDSGGDRLIESPKKPLLRRRAG